MTCLNGYSYDRDVIFHESGSANIVKATAPITDNDQTAATTLDNPRLLTTITLAKLRLSFLNRCRPLKRPPKSLRAKCSKLSSCFVSVCSKSETELLETAIADQKNYIRKLVRTRKVSDQSKLDPRDDRRVDMVRCDLDKKFQSLKNESETKWNSWPDKTTSTGQTNRQRKIPSL